MHQIALQRGGLSRILQKPCYLDVLFERLPPSWRGSLMVSMPISVDTNDVRIPLAEPSVGAARRHTTTSSR